MEALRRYSLPGTVALGLTREPELPLQGGSFLLGDTLPCDRHVAMSGLRLFSLSPGCCPGCGLFQLSRIGRRRARTGEEKSSRNPDPGAGGGDGVWG